MAAAERPQPAHAQHWRVPRCVRFHSALILHKTSVHRNSRLEAPAVECRCSSRALSPPPSQIWPAANPLPESEARELLPPDSDTRSSPHPHFYKSESGRSAAPQADPWFPQALSNREKRCRLSARLEDL